MYSILPAFVSSIFLGYGFYVLVTKGVTRLSVPFFLMCVTTFAWQGTWACLFQVTRPDLALLLVKVGYLFILFLPTTFYHFIVELTERRQERVWLLLSYGVALLLATVLLTTKLVVSDYYHYFFGDYPRAGPLHPVHVAQTLLLSMRCAWILVAARRRAFGERRRRLTLCLMSLGLYSVAAVDYAANYGFAIYPPGVIFIAISLLGLIALSFARYDLMHPYSLAATVAHEVRTPLTTIRMQAQELATVWPTVLHGYRLAVEQGLLEERLRPGQLERMPALIGAIRQEVDSTQAVIEMALASITLEKLDRGTFVPLGVAQCVTQAIERYPFAAGERERVAVQPIPPAWRFRGTDTLFVYVLFNLVKNALQAIRGRGDGMIEISASQAGAYHLLTVRDTGPGIPADVMPRIFDPFFSTKPHGAGVGLTFCRRVMEAFGGGIDCESVPGRYTLFTLRLPALYEADALAAQAAAAGDDALGRTPPLPQGAAACRDDGALARAVYRQGASAAGLR